MRHVSRTHRVALDRLFDRINLDPKIQIRYIDTKRQLADMLTKGNFIRDEWNNLLHLLNIRHFSSTCCTKNFSLISCSTMAKRIQNQKKRRRKSCVQVATSSDEYVITSTSAASSPIASKSPEMPIASGKTDSRISVEPSSFDTASTSQVRLKGGLMEKQRGDPSHQEEGKSEDSGNPAAGTWYYKGECVAHNNKAWRKPLTHGASSSVDQESQKNSEATWDHHLQISPDTSHFMEAVFSMVRKIYGKPPGDPMEDMIMNTTLQAAVHLGKDYDTSLRIVKNYLWKQQESFPGKQKS